MILEDIAKYIETHTPFTMGKDLFGGELQLDKDGISVIYGPSADSNKSLDVYEQTLDFWSRDPLTATSYDNLLSVFNLLHKAQNYETENYHIYFSNAIGAIDDMDRDVERRKLFKLAVRFIFRAK